MKLLAVSDEESKYLWDYYRPEKLDGVDLIISCGDLNAHYVDFLATVARVPLLYVHGNHDEGYDHNPPNGGICIDDSLYIYRGLRIVGLGGSCRYRNGSWQFTEAEMKKRVKRLRGRIDRAGGMDVLVTHAPMHGYGDFSDLPHRGFTAFQELLDAYKPPLMLHGHIHLNYGPNIPREQQYHNTRIINAYERFEAELPDPPDPALGKDPLWQRLWARHNGR
ncbi:MAG: metallophosphoesterase family protein [Gemmiger sp.]|nr:metallophosphoesterase family protein [Gemmiger sp.]